MEWYNTDEIGHTIYTAPTLIGKHPHDKLPMSVQLWGHVVGRRMHEDLLASVSISISVISPYFAFRSFVIFPIVRRILENLTSFNNPLKINKG